MSARSIIFNGDDVVTINSTRLLSRMQAMARVGALPGGGVCRLALTDADKAGRELFMQWCREIALEVTIDQMGSIFARKKGRLHQRSVNVVSTDTSKGAASVPVILTGSHLDTQPSGGRFDGVLGVLAALETVQVIIENEIPHDYDIEIVSWTNEEGARFAPAMVASGVFGGVFSLKDALDCRDANGIRLGDELDRIGFVGSRSAVYDASDPVKAYIELHIEQGPVLEQSGNMIGVVTGVQGIRWYDVVIQGKETHAGPAPMNMRNDPVPIMADLIQQIYAMAADYGEVSRVTIGEIQASPGSRNTVPGSIRLSVDIRHPDAKSLNLMSAQLLRICAQTEASCTEIWHSPPVSFDAGCIEAVQQSTQNYGYSHQRIVSGAGHDAVCVARVTPAAMIFIPCRDGLSHNEAEYSSDDQVIAGANVLLGTLLKVKDEVV